MNRRHFLNVSVAAGGLLTSGMNQNIWAAENLGSRSPGKKEKMQVAFDYFHGLNPAKIQMAKELGVRYAVSGIMHPRQLGLSSGNSWDLEVIKATVNKYEKHGMKLCVIEGPPALWTKTKLGLPGRDEEISNFITFIHNLKKVDIKVICYNWMPVISWFRTSVDRKTRGGSIVTAFDIDEARKMPLTEYGEISQESLWENMEYFMKAVVPEAEKAGVQLALHPDDPPIESVRGIGRILTSTNAMERAINLYKSPVNGVTFCQGTFATMGEDVPSSIFRFKDKIFFVHFRDIKGNKDHYEEVYHDDGITDMYATMKAYYEIGFTGPIRTDHVPTMTGESNDNPSYGLLGNLFATGYMRGLMEAADKETSIK